MLENIFDVLSLPPQLSPLPGASHTRVPHFWPMLFTNSA